MNHIIVASFLCLLLTNVHSWDINSYSTFSFDENANALGVESNVKNFISLANDPKSSLPDSFTICSSILLKFINGGAHFVQMYTEDGSHWFNFQLGSFPNSSRESFFTVDIVGTRLASKTKQRSLNILYETIKHKRIKIMIMRIGITDERMTSACASS